MLGPVLTPERNVDEPVHWPVGGAPQAVVTPGGVLVSGQDEVHSIVRMWFADGGMGPIGDLGPSQAPISLAMTPAGAVALVLPRGTDAVFSQLVDPATGVLVGPRRDLGVKINVSPPLLFLSGTANSLLMIWRDSADAGLRIQVVSLDEQGLPQGQPIDLTRYGSLGELASSADRHWATFAATLPDAGPAIAVALLDADGAPNLVRTLEGHSGPLVATPQGAWVGSTHDGGTMTLLSPAGQVLAQTPLLIGEWAGTAVGDEAWLALADNSSQLVRRDRIRLVRLFSDGGHQEARIVESDGGEIRPAALAAGPRPVLLFERVFQEVGQGSARGAFAQPLTAQGAPMGSPFPVFLRPSHERSPSLAWSGPGSTVALAWNDDRSLPFEYQLEATMLRADGELLRAPIALERLTSDFTGLNDWGRFVASHPEGFVFTAWNGFWVSPIAWALDGGAPILQEPVTRAHHVAGPPLVCSLDSGYLVTWDAVPDWVMRRVDARGLALEASMPLPGFVVDVRSTGEGCRILVADSTRLQLLSAGPSGPVRDAGFVSVSDGGWITAARLASTGGVRLVAWQESEGASASWFRALRFDTTTGAPIDAVPLEVKLATFQHQRSLTDIGVQNGVFHVLGVSPTDAGSMAWLWRIPSDGGAGDDAPVFLESLGNVTSLVSGPQRPDGGLLIAYEREHPELFPGTRRVHLRAIGTDLAVGTGCDFATDCESGFCVDGVCCESACEGDELVCSAAKGSSAEGRCEKRRGPVVYQLGCSCDAAPPIPLALAALAAFLRRRRCRNSVQVHWQ